MVIQHNISALNAHRNMGLNNAGTSKNLEKLSSGYKVNRAGDDAAGLAISEKMRGQIRGLAMAEQNTSNGVSLIQTAEGGLNETHSILQRMRELAVQSANGTYQDEDRTQITKEFAALKSEIDRIAESTHYNGIKLLDGSLDTKPLGTVTADATSMIKNVEVGSLQKGDYLSIDTGTLILGSTTPAQTASGSFQVTGVGTLTTTSTFGFTFAGENLSATLTGDNSADGIAAAIANAIITTHSNYSSLGFTVQATGDKVELTANNAGLAGQTLVSGQAFSAWTGGATPTLGAYAPASTGADEIFVAPQLNTPEISINGTAVATTVSYDRSSNTFTLSNAANGVSFTLDASKITGDNQAATASVNTGKNLVFQIGANGGQDQRVNLGIANMASKNIGLRAGNVKTDGTAATANDAEMLETASVATTAFANKAIEIINAATNQVSGQRAELGALQNRLEHTLNNLGVTKENLTAAESSIRDVDMAKEMMDFTKNNILVQASQAMLAQANQLPQGVLQLLR